MDNAPPKLSKSSSKIHGIFHEFAKVCKLTPPSGGGAGNPACDPHFEDCSTEETEGGDDNNISKIHPQPFDETPVGTRVDLVELVPKLFDSISSLKLSYIQFQQAHIPYDPDKIRLADELMVSQLDSLSDIEHMYVDKQSRKTKTLASLNAEIDEQQGLLEKLQSQALVKDTEILQLRWELEELDLKNSELEEEVRRTLSPEEEVLLSHQDLTPRLFSFAFETTMKSIHNFGKPLIGLMKASGWDLDRAADSIVPSVIYAKRSHKKYAFEAYVSRIMFSKDGSMAKDWFREGNIGSVMMFCDPFDALIEDSESNFAQFCLLKYTSIVQPEMEYSLFGNLDQRNFVLNHRHPRTPFYRAFAKMARWVWVLQVMAASIVPRAEMFCVEPGEEFYKEEMESVVMMEDDKSKVGFIVMPGFRIGSNVIRCKVYLQGLK